MRHRAIVLFFALAAGISCSVPNLETPDCSAAKNDMRRFYSFHLGNDMTPSPENLKKREDFLTPDLYNALSSRRQGAEDYFTATADYPKAFRVGTCSDVAAREMVDVQVLLFWRSDTRTEQREIWVQAVWSVDKWLVNKVESR